MQRMHFNYLFILIFSILSLSESLNAATLYQLTDIGRLNINSTDAQNLKLKINDSDQVVGWERVSNTSSSTLQGFVWDKANGKTYPLNTTQSHQFFTINNNGTVVGVVLDDSNATQAYSWQDNFTKQNILSVTGESRSASYALNVLDKIAMTAEFSGGSTEGYFWSGPGSHQLIPSLSGSFTIEAMNDGDALAISHYSANGATAMLYDAGNTTDVNALYANVLRSWASDVSNSGILVGGMQYSPTGLANPRQVRTYAYQWDSINGLVNLGEQITGVSWASSINDAAQIVGGRMFNIIERQAVLWETSASFKLASLTQNIGNWQLIDATDINSNGVIVGIGILNSFYRGFILEPVVSSVASADLSILIEPNSLINSSKPAIQKTGARCTSCTIDNANQFITVRLKNNGPDIAHDVALSVAGIPDELQNTLSNPANNCFFETNKLQCEIAALSVDEELSISIDTSPLVNGDYELSANVSASEIDPGVNSDNNITRKLTISRQAVTNPIISDPVISIVQPDDNDAQQSTSEDSASSSPTPSDSTSSSTDKQSSSTSGGCSISENNAFDPLFLLLVGLAVITLRSRRNLLR